MSGDISFSGLSSGIDFESMISQLVEAEKFQVRKLTSWKEEWQQKTDLLKELNTKLSSVTTASETLKSYSSFYSRLADTSVSTVADIAVDSSAVPGAYNLSVAKNSKHIIASRGFDNSDTELVVAIGDNKTLAFDDGEGNSISVSLNGGVSGLTLEEVKTAVDSELSLQGSNATTEINFDNSSNEGYRLRIIAGVGGNSGQFSSISDDSDLSFNQSQIQNTVEEIDKEGTATLTAGGTYTGHVNKRLTFEVLSSGTKTIGTDSIDLKWYDNVEGTTGTAVISTESNINTDIVVDITQGIQLTVNTEDLTKTLNNGDSFAIDVFHPDVQLGQDSGLAQAEKEVHSGFSDKDTTAVTTIDDSLFSYSFGGITVAPISVPKDSTLQDLTDLINEDPENPGVKATIINDGTGSSNAYHLVLTGTKSGAANKIEDIDFSTFSAGVFSAGSFSETQSAINSQVKLDGYPSDDTYIQSSSNLITDLIDGASLSLKSAGSTEITIANDTDEMLDKVKDFIDAYNEAMDYINNITKVNENEKGEAVYGASGMLVGNYSVQIIESELKLYVSQAGIGFEDGVDSFTILGQIGIATGENEQLELDEEIFLQALKEKPDEVVSFFAANKEGVSSNTNVSFSSCTGLTQQGKYNYKIEVDASGDATSGIYWYDGETEADGRTLTIDSTGKFLTAMTGDAKGLAVQVTGGASTTLEGTLRLKFGKAQEYYDKMTTLLDEDAGIIKVLTKNYENIMENIENKIGRENDRVDMVESRLKARFANLEVSLTNYNGQMSTLQQQLSSLPSSV